MTVHVPLWVIQWPILVGDAIANLVEGMPMRTVQLCIANKCTLRKSARNLCGAPDMGDLIAEEREAEFGGFKNTKSVKSLFIPGLRLRTWTSTNATIFARWGWRRVNCGKDKEV